MKKTALLIFALVVLALMASCSHKSENKEPTTSLHPNFTVRSTLLDYDNYEYTGEPDFVPWTMEADNGDGSISMNPDYVSVQKVTENRFIANKFLKEGRHTALIDENGKEIIPLFRGDIIRINQTDKEAFEPILLVDPLYGEDSFVDINGKKITEQTFIGAGFTYQGFFYGHAKDEYFFYEDSGKLICSVKKDEIGELKDLKNGYILLVQNHGRYYRYGLKKVGGEQFIPCEYNEITVVSDNLFVARIGDPQGLDLHDIIRIYDGEGNQLSKDGEFHVAYYEKGAEYGIAQKLATGGIDDYIRTYWIIDSKGQRASENYDKIETKDGIFYGTNNGKTEKILLK